MDQIGEEQLDERRMANDLRTGVASFEMLEGDKIRGKPIALLNLDESAHDVL
jgi:hypothetical protein